MCAQKVIDNDGKKQKKLQFYQFADNWNSGYYATTNLYLYVYYSIQHEMYNDETRSKY
jgi:hypothetical protein